MGLFRTLKKSIYSPEFYRSLLDAPFKFSFKYFASLALSFAVAMTILVAPALIPRAMDFLKGAALSLDAFPQDLLVTLSGGVVSTNTTSTVSFPAPPSMRALFESGGAAPENVAVIDTSSTFSEERFAGYHTLFLVTKNNIVSGYDGEIRIDSLKDTEDAKIDKAKAQAIAGKVRTALGWIPAGMVFLIFLIMVFLSAGVLAYLLPIAVLVHIIARIRKIPVGYKKSYQLALHGASLGLILLPFKLVLFTFLPVSYFLILAAIVAIEILVNLKAGERLPVLAEEGKEKPDHQNPVA